MYDLITDGELSFPPYYFSEEAKEFIESLLVKDPHKRLHDSVEVKKLAWMSPINFDILLQRKLKPPFVPVANSDDDTSNIDPEFLEEVPPGFDLCCSCLDLLGH